MYLDLSELYLLKSLNQIMNNFKCFETYVLDNLVFIEIEESEKKSKVVKKLIHTKALFQRDFMLHPLYVWLCGFQKIVHQLT